jgi:hypothetical protein
MEPSATGTASGAAPSQKFNGRRETASVPRHLGCAAAMPGLIERPRLLGLTPQLLKAPAGFGKTSLVVSWFQRLQELRAGFGFGRR